MMRIARMLRVAEVIALFVCTGCSIVGPVAVRGDRFNYNEAGAESTKEQLLLNMVRLRYGAPIYVMEIGSMVGSHSLTANASFSGWWNNLNELANPTLMAIYGNDKHPTQQRSWGAGIGYTDSPTITFTPVEGERFADRMMTAIPPITIIQLSDSGWRIDQLLECCVQWVNGIPNTPVNPDVEAEPPDTTRFRRIAELMRLVQKGGELVFAIEAPADGSKTVYLHPDARMERMAAERRELRHLLGYEDGPLRELKLVPAPFQRSPDELAIKTRSLLGIMTALAQTVHVPEEHVDRGWVVGCGSDAAPGSARWMTVHCSALPHAESFVQVFYKGHWFYIDEKDTSSKATFALLDYLFSLQQTTKGQSLPVVTVPAR